MSILQAPPDLSRRRGKITISREMIDAVLRGKTDALAAWNAVFKDFVTIHTESNWMSSACTYTGCHPEFEVGEEGAAVSTYEVTIQRETIDPGVVLFTARFRKQP